ncbi:MAG: hypothetical protein COX90_00425 [Candidatus Nealsonbacteria bacterium CG_4_10_14_0_2_um_filter_38_17]|uniref:Isopentenyl phosphate kinase n=2 Tax=Candidatus Nealsoniibacteriota TaxID=1817911 RepID=A0A2M7UZ15_9BACT|nr:MAG: hypothetical protein COX36_00795 [Candidatus Nealsonbacteria bacterium CG23_combo_of_CG06-09_8_20_14_all_38_19]PIZ89223.1 MAG: hypothetical protein COX90_00425 [Candidatus Nealsonbacteria bacterium CG_4_10_14_0_2_um_filter_38_17]
MKDLLILKIGGSVITDKFSDKPKVNSKNLKRISKEITLAYNSKKFSVILIHGAGSYGHVIVKKTGIDKGIKNNDQLKAFGETQRLQNELNSVVVRHLIDVGLPAIPFQASAGAVLKSGRLEKLDTVALKGFLEIGLIPVLYGVPAYDEIQKCSILSGDQIASFLARKLKAKKVIFGTDVDGIFNNDPKLDPKAMIIPEINLKNKNLVKKFLKGSLAKDVTGGMLGKFSEIIKSGAEGQVVNALKARNVQKALEGKKVGTIICKL